MEVKECKVCMSNERIEMAAFLGGTSFECCGCGYKTEVAQTRDEAIKIWNSPPEKESKMARLERYFLSAIEDNAPYIAVVVEMEGFEKPEIIINQRANFEKKLEYYKSTYNEDLILKSFNGIKIVDFGSGERFEVFESNLNF